jgi:hypothetical protein
MPQINTADKKRSTDYGAPADFQHDIASHQCPSGASISSLRIYHSNERTP